MSDITERLRFHALQVSVCDEAADTIDALRARVATLEQDADALVEGHVKVTVAGLTQQVERMTAALEWYANALGNSKSMDYRIITQDGGKRAGQALNRSEP
jgi:hypothetical protein